MAKIVFDREKCIGSGACIASDPDFWIVDADGKTTLKEAKYGEDSKMWILDIDEKDLKKHKETASLCPVNAIKIVDEDNAEVQSEQ